MATVSQWAFRLRKESEISDSAYFVTLTYDTDHVPITDKGYMSLDKKAVQDYIKRLRKREAENFQIKYFAVGEYGSKRMRPHYHLIVFNVVDTDNLFRAWSHRGKDFGNVHVGMVEGASIAYVLKYMVKEGKIPVHKNDDRVKEFRLMSKGLGKNYLSVQTIKYHRQDLSLKFLTIEDGIKVPMPRYFSERIWTKEEREKQKKILKQNLETKNERIRAKFERNNPGVDFTKKSYQEAQYRNRKLTDKGRDLE